MALRIYDAIDLAIALVRMHASTFPEDRRFHRSLADTLSPTDLETMVTLPFAPRTRT
jgi:hypothetical protein